MSDFWDVGISLSQDFSICLFDDTIRVCVTKIILYYALYSRGDLLGGRFRRTCTNIGCVQ